MALYCQALYHGLDTGRGKLTTGLFGSVTCYIANNTQTEQLKVTATLFAHDSLSKLGSSSLWSEGNSAGDDDFGWHHS